MTDQDIFEVRQTDVEIQEIFDQVPKNTKAIEDINGKLPEEASPENPLADKQYVDDQVATEKTRAEGAEQTLDGKIATEKNRAQGAENNLQQAINTEASRAAEAERVLDGKIAAEKTRAEGAEGTLQTAINNEAQAREQADGVLDGKIAAEKTRAEGAEGTLQTAINNEAQARQQADGVLDGKIAAEKTRAEGAEGALQTAIDIINGKIPAQATAQNQLADKEFVNSSISTATADFKGTYNSLQELEQVTANANDYAFVVATDAAGNTVYKRYKWVEGTGWTFEYDLNNSSFTAAQWAAIQSGITAALVTKLTDLPTNAELNQRVQNAIATALTSYYTKTEIDALVQSINTAVGQKASQADLTAETARARQAEQALQTGKQASITDGAQIGLGYGICSTDATTAAKVATIANFILLKNMPVSIRFTKSINVDGATLNISSTGAKPLFIQGAALQGGLVKAGCTITVIYDGTNYNVVCIEGLERPSSQSDLFVDMGLPSGLLWAIANIDVTTQSGFAEVDGKPSPFKYECTFFSWGNTEGHNPISTSAFSYNWGSSNDGPYAQTPGSKLTANAGLSYDAARAILGSPCHDPATEDFAELFVNIDYVQADGETVIDASVTNKLVTVNNIVGIYLKSKINGNLLFFPCSGYGNGQSWHNRGSDGYYWSRSLRSQTNGRDLYFFSGGVNPQGNNGRSYGFARRAVQ